MINPELMTTLLIVYLFIDGFINIIGGAARYEKSTKYDNINVASGIITVIIGIILLVIQ